MKNTTVIICLLMAFVIFVSGTQYTHAVPASPDSFTITQPDGTTFEAYQIGDEWNNRTETATGYTIVREPDTGYWEYAVTGPCGDLIPSGVAVKPDAEPPADIPKHLAPDTGSREKEDKNAPRSPSGEKPQT